MPSVGRIVTILGTGAGVFLAGGGNIKFASPHTSWAGAGDTSIQLVYDGSYWREIARSDTTPP
jgi:hypothetical protein